MTLTSGQQQAFTEITKGYRVGKSHLLIGYAGTGKTYLMDQVASHFISRGLSVAVTAPTHKAASVLKEKVKHEGVLCCTIHSLLSLVPKEDETGTSLERRKFASPIEVDIVVIDEASMLSHELMTWIRKLLKGKYVLFVGDDAQLPPVGEERSEAFDVTPVSTLDQIVRQAAGNPILDAAYACRVAQKEGNADWSFLTPQNKGKTGIFKASNADTWMRKAFLSEEFQRDPNAFRYLAWTNARVDAVNRKVQRWIFGDIDTPFAPGELVISKKRFERDGVVIENSQELTVTGIKTGSHKTAWKKHGNDEDYEIPIWEVDTDAGVPIRLVRDMRAFNEALAIVRKRCYNWERPVDDGPYSYVSNFRDAFGKLAANYAMTVHTSQGSTFKNAFIDAQDVLKRQRDNLLECQQLMYTAVTRASDMVFWV